MRPLGRGVRRARNLGAVEEPIHVDNISPSERYFLSLLPKYRRERRSGAGILLY